MCAHNDMNVVEFPCMCSTTLLTLSTPCEVLGWIHNLYEFSFIYLCMVRPLLYLVLLQLILSSMELLFFLEFPHQHIELLLYSILCLHTIFMSHHHLINSISISSFIMSGLALNFQFFFASMFSTTFPLHSSCEGVLPSTAANGAAFFDVIGIDLNILVH